MQGKFIHPKKVYNHPGNVISRSRFDFEHYEKARKASRGNERKTYSIPSIFQIHVFIILGFREEEGGELGQSV